MGLGVTVESGEKERGEDQMVAIRGGGKERLLFR